MSFVWVQSSQTREIQQKSALPMWMHLNWLLQFSATVLMILGCGTFREIHWMQKSTFWGQNVSNWWCDSMTNLAKPQRQKRKLSPSSTLSSLLESKWSTLPSVQLSPAWTSGSDKASQDFSVRIFQRTSETHLLRTDRASTTQQGCDWLNFFSLFLPLSVCATSNLKLNNILET